MTTKKEDLEKQGLISSVKTEEEVEAIEEEAKADKKTETCPKCGAKAFLPTEAEGYKLYECRACGYGYRGWPPKMETK